MPLSDSAIEKIVDARVMRRLATDSAYRNAENAEIQAEREQEIADEEYNKVMRGREYNTPHSSAGF